jgi:hypothetical protein
MSAFAKMSSDGLHQERADLLAALAETSVPALRPLGIARVIHAWEAPRDLWQGEAGEAPAALTSSLSSTARVASGH